MTYNGGKKALLCGSCGYQRVLGKDNDQIGERALGTSVSFDTFTFGLGREMQAYKCGGCKAHFAQVPEEVATFCPFCQAPDPEGVQSLKNLQPFNILPFTIPYEAARSKLYRWLSTSWFLPRGIRNLAGPETLRGVYFPMLVLDGFTRSTWKGQAQFSVMEVQKSGPVQKKVQEPTTGYFEHFFDECTFHLSSGLQDKSLMPLIGSFRTREAVGYDASYLKGWTIEMYQKKESDGINFLNGMMDGYINGQVKKRIKGEEVKDLKILTEKLCVAVRVVLLPVWVAAYSYGGRRFQYLINGHSGEITGEKPLSLAKMLIAIGVGILLIILLVLWIRL